MNNAVATTLLKLLVEQSISKFGVTSILLFNCYACYFNFNFGKLKKLGLGKLVRHLS